jgi:hypothetical protein
MSRFTGVVMRFVDVLQSPLLQTYPGTSNSNAETTDLSL